MSLYLRDCSIGQANSEFNKAQKWIDLIAKYTEPTEPTATLLNELINKIVAHEAQKGC